MSGHFKVYFKGYLCIIEEQCSDKENVHEEDKTAAKRPLLIFYAKVNGCILRI